jgi:hypothetical protein
MAITGPVKQVDSGLTPPRRRATLPTHRNRRVRDDSDNDEPCCLVCLLVVVGELSFTDFYAAPIALLNALVAEVARRSRMRALGRLTQLDDLAAARGYLLGGRRAAEV